MLINRPQQDPTFCIPIIEFWGVHFCLMIENPESGCSQTRNAFDKLPADDEFSLGLEWTSGLARNVYFRSGLVTGFWQQPC
jgi:hypothetical protein